MTEADIDRYRLGPDGKEPYFEDVLAGDETHRPLWARLATPFAASIALLALGLAVVARVLWH